MKGYIQIYTGNGKGKTTAAFGLALRAAGAGKKIFIAQFVKGKSYSEIKAVEKYLPEIEIKQYGRGCFIVNKPGKEDIDVAQRGLKEVSEIISRGIYDIIILDEACIALYFQLFSLADFIQVLDVRHESTEIIITGRYAPPELIEKADLVTVMEDTKHYYAKGIEAREGIEY